MGKKIHSVPIRHVQVRHDNSNGVIFKKLDGLRFVAGFQNLDIERAGNKFSYQYSRVGFIVHKQKLRRLQFHVDHRPALPVRTKGPRWVHGQALQKLRKEKRLSQEALALNCDLDRTFISLLERGERQPSLTTVFKIANELEIASSEIVAAVEKAVAKTIRR